MANFRSTADYLDSILLLAGETTNGNSAYEARVLHYLNQMHNAIVTGGNEFNVEVDEMWPWAMAKDPMIIELAPKYNTGTVALTNGSSAGTLSTASAGSLKDYHIQQVGAEDIYRIVSHTAGGTAIELDSKYANTSETAATFTAFKLDYELVPDIIVITDLNNKINFTEATAGTELTATLTVGSYTIAELLTEMDTQLDAAGASSYTSSYNSVTRKFTILSDLAGADNLFSILGASGTEALIYASALPTLGLGLKDHTGAASYTSERALGSIARLVQPFKIHTGSTRSDDISGIDKTRFNTDYALSVTQEGDPKTFCVIEERDDGYMKVRFNKYPDEAKRVEIQYMPSPLNLYDNTKAHPLIPRKYARLLDYGGAAYLMGEKNDNRSVQYFQLAGQLLDAMMKNNRKEAERIGEFFGEIIARPDLIPSTRTLRYGEPADS
jgi:hypothetical protein